MSTNPYHYRECPYRCGFLGNAAEVEAHKPKCDNEPGYVCSLRCGFEGTKRQVRDHMPNCPNRQRAAMRGRLPGAPGPSASGPPGLRRFTPSIPDFRGRGPSRHGSHSRSSSQGSTYSRNTSPAPNGSGSRTTSPYPGRVGGRF